MAIYTMKRGLAAGLAALPIEDGAFILTKDSQKLYADIGSKRYYVGDIIVVDALPEADINAEKFYFLTTDNCLYRRSGEAWVNLSKAGINITTGTTNGTISVDGKEVAVFGLGSAAFVDKADVETKYFTVGTEIELNTLTGMKQGDIATVKKLIAGEAGKESAKYEYTGYVYDDETWKAMDGNYSVENVFFKDDIILAGNYTSVGNVSKGSANATGKLSAAGKSVKDVFQSLFTQELQPNITAAPTVSLTFQQAGAYEVGTTVNPSYTASLSAGSYTYGPATGVTAQSWAVSDTNGNSSVEASDSFPAFTVADDTSYKITAVAAHGAGAIANTNLGNATTLKIEAGSKSKVSGTVTGYRKSFYGSKATPVELTSSNIRGLTGGNSSTKSFNVTVVEGARQVIIAVPTGLTLKKVEDVGAFGTDIVGSFVKNDVDVEGANGFTAKAYNVYVYSPAAALGANTYKVTVG